MPDISRRAPQGRSSLIVPARSCSVLNRALSSGVSLVGFDLEDGLAPALKADGRQFVDEVLNERSSESTTFVLVRLNALTTSAGIEDLSHFLTPGRNMPDGFLLTKVEHSREIEIYRDLLADSGSPELWALIETPGGIENAFSICAAGVGGVVLGAADLAARTHSVRTWENLLFARTRLVAAARSHEIPCIDSPYFDLQDSKGLAEEAMKAFRLGFSSKAAVHPGQIEIIEQSFKPTKRELRCAQEILEAPRVTGAVRLGGRMVGPPLIQEALNTVQGGAAVQKEVTNETTG